MNVTEMRNELSIKGKNGVGFLSAGVIIWMIVTFLFTLPIDIMNKNMYMMFSTGLLFPLAVAISTLIKADWKNNDNPLGQLGLILNLAQLIYFPILIWVFGNSPEYAVMCFAIITGAHFFPYGWLYRAKGYIIMSPVISVFILIIGWVLEGENLWLVPLSMVILLIWLVGWVYIDYKIKARTDKLSASKAATL